VDDPPPDGRGVEVVEGDIAQRGEDVVLELLGVQLAYALPKRLTLRREPGLDPPRRVLPQGRATSARRYDLAVGLLGERSDVDGLGRSFRRERAEADPSPVGGDDANSVPAGRELVDSTSGSALARHGAS
jgi:hypothetical protein